MAHWKVDEKATIRNRYNRISLPSQNILQQIKNRNQAELSGTDTIEFHIKILVLEIKQLYAANMPNHVQNAKDGFAR